MRTKFLLQCIVLMTSLAMVSISCDDDDDDQTAQPNIATIVNTNPDFSILNTAITRAGLGSALSTGSLTVFAPDNAAFAASGVTEVIVNSLPVPTLDSLLKYHILASEVGSSSVPASDAVTTVLGTSLFVSNNSNGVFANGIKVKSADIDASNGVVHVISKVLFPPTQTIAQIASADTSFSYLLAAVTKAGLASAVSGPGKFTVFAPTNAAFRAAGFSTIADINAAPTDLITTVVKYHVLSTNVFSGDLTDGLSAPSLQGGNLTVNLSPARVKISSSAAPSSNITATDIVATNGVIHVIDRVLLQ